MKTKLTEHWAEADREVVQAEQLRLLKYHLKHKVIPFTPYYRESLADVEVDDLQSLADVEQLPFTRKSSFTADGRTPRDFVMQPDEEVLKKLPSTIVHAITRGPQSARKALADEFRPVMMTSTTGRSADPVPFVYTRQDVANLELAGLRIMELGESQQEWRHLNCFPFAPHLAFWQVHYAVSKFGAFLVSTGGGKTMGTAGNLRLLGKVEPEILVGMPTFIYHLLQQAVEGDLPLKKLRCVVLGGEKAPAGYRRKVLELCRQAGNDEVKILSTYGFTEAKMAFPEIPSADPEGSSGFLTFPDLGLIEIIDPETGRLLPDETAGEIVFTALQARGSHVVRYRTGDIAEGGLTWRPDPLTGRRCPRILGPISRVSDVKRLSLDKVKGTLVDFNKLEHCLDELSEVRAWQVELRKLNDDPNGLDQLIVHATAEGVDRGEVEHKIRDAMQAATELTPNLVEFHSMEVLREKLGVGELLKEEKVADHRPKGD